MKINSLLQQKLRSVVHPILLSLLCLYLIVVNHVPNTYLSGWDTLHPEFNFSINLARQINGVFRTDHGLGAVAAHSHMSDLPRVAVLMISSAIIPTQLLRYFFISLSLLLGALGCYFFIYKCLLVDKNSAISQLSSFLGALFYIFNLGTLQHFHVPFEMFTVQYAALPWLFLSASYYLRSSSTNKLILFGFVTLLSTPMAYAATLWYAYFLALVFFLFPFYKTFLKKSLVLIGITVAINSFWLLPNLYFLFSGNADLVPQSRMNKIFSEEAFTYNKNYGNFIDAIIFKNFLFDWPVYIGNDRFDYLMAIWRNHLSSPYIITIGYILFIFVLVGIFYTWKSKNVFHKALFLPALLCILFIINANPPFAFLFEYFRDFSSIIKESLRFPFTKFSIILIFLFSSYFAIGQNLLLGLISRAKYLFCTVITLSFFIYMFPYFNGHLISKYVQVKIPQEYFEMFEWFNSREYDGRVATLPIHSFWGWIYYNWGFQGAQFITFGIKQPVLDRDYDRWQNANESYYKQMAYAIYSQNPDLISNVLEKYKIKYILVDNNVIAPGPNQDKKMLFTEQINSVFSRMEGTLTTAKKFNNLIVYQVNLETSHKQFVLTTDNLISINGPIGPYDIDWPYKQYGTYIDTKTSKFNPIYYPFRSLSDNQNIANGDLIQFKDSQLKLSLKNLRWSMTLPLQDFLEHEPLIQAQLYIKFSSLLEAQLKLKTVEEDNNPLDLHLDYKVPLESVPQSANDWLVSIDENQIITLKDIYNLNPTYQGDIFINSKQYTNLAFYTDRKDVFTNQLALIQPAQSCGYPQSGQITGATIVNDHDIKIIAKNGVSCVKFPLSKVLDKYQFGYYKNLLNFNFFISSATSNLGHFCIYDHTVKRCIKELKNIPNDTLISEYLVTSTDDIEKLDLVLFLNSNNPDVIEEIIYKNLSFYKYNPVVFLSVSPDDIQKAFSQKSIHLDKDKLLNLSSVLYNHEQQFNIFKEKNPSNFCSNILPKKFNRKINQQESFIEYTSEAGSSCDYFSFLDLPHNVGYALIVETQHLSGLPLRMCVANNHTRKCDLYLALPANKHFEKQILLIPPANDGNSGYNIHFDNYSIGKTISVNRLRGLQILPFPYLWLSKIHQQTGFKNHLAGSLILKEVYEFSPAAYMLNYQNTGSGYGLIQLNKTYEGGWWMWEGSHVKVNGWANGWLIEPSREGTTIILYIPQLFQFSGFGILGLLACLSANFYLKKINFSWQLRFRRAFGFWRNN